MSWPIVFARLVLSEWCRLSLKIVGYLISFSIYPPFCTIGWWRHFVFKKQRKYTSVTIFPKGNWLKIFLYMRCLSKHCIQSLDNFYYFFQLRCNVSFNSSLSKISYTYISTCCPYDLQTKWRHQQIFEISGWRENEMRYQRNLNRIPYHSTVPMIWSSKNFRFTTPLSLKAFTQASFDSSFL